MNYLELLENGDNQKLKLVYDFVQYTNKNIFLTGKAGTGKTTFLKALKELLPKRMVVVAPTGVAAINAGGVTIHSFFQLSFGPQIPNNNYEDIIIQRNKYRFSGSKINIIKSLDLLVIDEISMVRADLLDGIDEVLKRYRNKDLPFGGVQLLMIGDLQQLSPVVKQDELEMLKNYYKNMYFFSSRALNATQYISIELEFIYRQKDIKFINLLNKVRDNNLDNKSLDELNKKYDENLSKTIPKGFIILTTHNHKANKINDYKLSKIQGRSYNFEAYVEGDFPENSYPIEYNLVFKEGAQVMFMKNDISPEKLYYNGKIGVIEEIVDDAIFVKCEGEDDLISVSPVEWENIKYTINDDSKEIETKVEGKFIQYPLKLAWAITIHKSQGLTFEKAVIDAKGAFAHGQVYVALSRCRSIEGMFLNSKLSKSSIKSDEVVNEFINDIILNQPDENFLTKSKNEYQKHILLELFDFKKIGGFLWYCLKVYNDNSNIIQVEFYETINKVLNVLNNEIIEVSKKFESQLIKMTVLNPDIENNIELIDRVKKGSIYFYDKLLEHVEKPIYNVVIECDNKAVVKSLNKIIKKIEDELRIKIACLNICKRGFSVKSYLEVKAKSGIKKVEKKKAKNKIEVKAGSEKNKVLYNMLKEWRDLKADEIGTVQYMIIQLKPITTISEILPQSIEELEIIKGIGEKTIKKYGEEIINIVNEYINKNPEIDKSSIDFEKVSVKKTKTHLETFKLYKDEKSIETVAKIRQMSVSTIEKHITICIKEGLIDIIEIIDDKKINIIKDEFKKQGGEFLKPVKESLGDEYSYYELKCVKAYLDINLN